MKRYIAIASEKLCKITNIILMILFLVLIILVTINVIVRYVFNTSFFVAGELANYLLVYIIFLGAALALKSGEHVRIEIENFGFSSHMEQIVHAIAMLVSGIFIIFLIVYGAMLTMENMNSYTGILPIPMGAVYAAAPLSGMMMAIHYIDLLCNRKE